MNFLEVAESYLNTGLSIFPLGKKSKKPAISWKEYQCRRPTDEELFSWFGNGLQNNIAIVTGKISGVVVVDMDSEEAIRLTKEQGFPNTPLVETGRGYHAYFKYREGIRNFQKRGDLPGIDLRGDGGYVVAPPSVHPSGKQYSWVKGRNLDDLPLPDLPSWILSEKSEDKTPLKELYRGVSEGNRNDALARLVGSWVNDGLFFEECLKIAMTCNARNKPPLPEEEVERTVKSIYEKHHRELSICPDIYIPGRMDNLNFDYPSALKKGLELQDMDVSLTWAVHRLIPQESITILSGKGGVGKTWLSIQLADAVSKGNPFMGLATKHMPVVYIDFENSLPVLVERIRKTGASEVWFWHAISEIKTPKIDSNDWELYSCLPQNSLLIFDTLRSAQIQDENDSRQMALV